MIVKNLQLLLRKQKHKKKRIISTLILNFYSDYKEYNTDTTIKFVVSMNPEKLQKAENEGIHKFFKLHSSLGLTSMVKTQILIHTEYT